MKVFAGRITSSPGPTPSGPQRELEGVGAVGDADAVPGAGELGVRLLEGGDGLAADEVAGGEDLGEAGVDLLGDLGVLHGQVDQRDGVHGWVLLGEVGRS